MEKWVCVVPKHFTNRFNSIRKVVYIDKKEEVLEPNLVEHLHKTVPNLKSFAIQYTQRSRGDFSQSQSFGNKACKQSNKVLKTKVKTQKVPQIQ